MLSPILLPQEIIFKVLKELSVKTLLRFRAVSKLWCSIIDDPVFVDSHRTRSYTCTSGTSIICRYIENRKLKVYTTDPEGVSAVTYLTLPVYGHECNYYKTCLQSVSGLVCRKNYIWNPSTRESIGLPSTGTEYLYPKNLLGFDSATKLYKVVHTCYVIIGRIRRAEFWILTLGRDLYWRNLDSVPEELSFRTGLGVCCVDDVIFCLGSVDSNEVIVAFEVGPEKFRMIPLPNEAPALSMRNHIIQVGGRLGFVNVYDARAGEVDVDSMMNVKVVEGLDNDDDDDDGDDEEEVEMVEVMNIWILEDYHKQQWKKEIFTFPLHRRDKHYGIKTSIMTTLMGSMHTSEILLCSKGENRYRDSSYICSYYDLERKSLRMVPKLTKFLNDNQHPEKYSKDLKFVGFTKHVECLFRLIVT